jgi:hypothetical protein
VRFFVHKNSHAWKVDSYRDAMGYTYSYVAFQLAR